jgi:hypothetical protein
LNETTEPAQLKTKQGISYRQFPSTKVRIFLNLEKTSYICVKYCLNPQDILIASVRKSQLVGLPDFIFSRLTQVSR